MERAQVTVLVVEDEASIRRFIAINLTRNGFQVLEAESGEEALELFGFHRPEVVILDIMLPGQDGFAVCPKLREMMPEAIIIMLTARGQDMDKIMGLEIGADDYMVKPFNPLELIARIRANLRKLGPSGTPGNRCLTYGEFTLDPGGQRFFKNKRRLI